MAQTRVGMRQRADEQIAQAALSAPAGASLIHQATVTLTDQQIKELPTTPHVMVAATETLGYSGVPTRLPIPVGFTAVLNNLAGAYTNVDAVAYCMIAYGSDWSDDASHRNKCEGQFANAQVHLIWAQIPKFGVVDTELVDNLHASDNFQDNALVFVLSNESLGNLTGGHASNTLIVSVAYMLFNLTTGLYEAA